ncbi:hypothetical protein DAMA08_038190 [Martiniozyma asiatica (nom. inval.)]|nr:hypothetical protein DAMA08_038190 [Martiniozyma asiatica]
MSKVSVVLYGSNGLLFKPLTEKFIENYKDVIELPIKVITRDATNKVSTDDIRYYQVDSTNSEDFRDVLTGADVLINIAGLGWDTPIQAAYDLKIPLKLYIGPQFGSELDKSDLAKEVPIFNCKFDHTIYWRKKGFKVIDFLNSLFIIDGSINTDDLVMFDYNKDDNSVNVFGDENLKNDYSYLADVGNGVGALIKKGHLEGFETLKDRIYISSVQLSQNDIFLNYEKRHGTKLNKRYVSKEQCLQEAIDRAKSNFSWHEIWYYIHVVCAQGAEKGAVFASSDKEYLNPNESLFKWTKYSSY